MKTELCEWCRPPNTKHEYCRKVFSRGSFNTGYGDVTRRCPCKGECEAE